MIAELISNVIDIKQIVAQVKYKYEALQYTFNPFIQHVQKIPVTFNSPYNRTLVDDTITLIIKYEIVSYVSQLYKPAFD